MNKALVLFDFNYGDISHLKTLQTLSNEHDELAVALKVEPKQKMGEPPLIERYMYLESLAQVDKIVPYCTEQDLHNIFHNYNFNTLCLSDIYSRTTFTGKDICEKNNVEIKYFPTGVAFTYFKNDQTGWK